MSASRLPAGVVTGENYRHLVSACKAGGYALAGVNVTSTSTLNAALEAAGRARSDLIIQLSNGGAQFFAGRGLKDALEAKILGAVSAARHAHLVAKHYGICVVMHTDHANKGLVPWVEGLIEYSEREHAATGSPLFSSHMLDLSEEPLEENLAECKRVLERMAKIDMSLEIELGVTGGEEDGVGSDVDSSADNSHLYTQPSEVLAAYDQLSSIGTFSVAASFGNVHGVYKPGNVKLRPSILRDSQALVQKERKLEANPLDLVFHGGSGSSVSEIREAISYGVFKMNIDTDTQFAYAKAVGEFVKANPRAFEYQLDPDDGTPYKKLYDPRKWIRAAEEGMAARLAETFETLGSAGNTLAE